MTAGLMLACGVLTTGAAGWVSAVAQDQPAGSGRGPAADPTAKRGPETDRDRIARLERERDELLKLVADLRMRVAALEAGQKQPLGTDFTPAPNNVTNRTLTPLGGVDGVTFNPNTVPSVGAGVAPLAAGLPAAQPGVGTAALPTVTLPGAGPPKMPGMMPGDVGLNAAPDRVRSRLNNVSAGMVVRVYAVDGLAADDKQAESLVKVLKAAVDPSSWQGGAGVEYYPAGHALVVRQTADGHRQVQEVLDLLKTAVKPHGQNSPGGGGPSSSGSLPPKM